MKFCIFSSEKISSKAHIFRILKILRITQARSICTRKKYELDIGFNSYLFKVPKVIRMLHQNVLPMAFRFLVDLRLASESSKSEFTPFKMMESNFPSLVKDVVDFFLFMFKTALIGAQHTYQFLAISDPETVKFLILSVIATLIFYLITNYRDLTNSLQIRSLLKILFILVAASTIIGFLFGHSGPTDNYFYDYQNPIFVSASWNYFIFGML